MRPLLFCAFLAASCGGCSNAPSSQSGPSNVGASVRQIVPKGATSFSSKRGFAVWLPSTPVQSQQSAPIGNGETINTFVFQASSGAVNYVVLAIPTTPSTKVSDPKGQLDVIEKSAMATVQRASPGATVQKREELRLGDFQGREIKMSLLKGAATGRMRLYFTPKSVYQIIAGGKKADVEKQSAQIERVFDSFRISPQ